MIVDYDDDKENDGWQSDIVSIALNLAFIKDLEQLKRLVAFGQKKGKLSEQGLILNPEFNKIDEVPEYINMEDPDAEAKKIKAKEKKEKQAKRLAL